MDMFADEEYTEKVDMKNEVKVAKGEWLHLQMKLMNKIDDGTRFIFFSLGFSIVEYSIKFKLVKILSTR